MLTRRAALSMPLALGAQAVQKPNFVLILLDDLGCTDLGCYGARDLKTPHIDALSGTGVRFTNWYSNAPVCAPSRASLLTGLYPASAGVPTNGSALPADKPTIASLLKPAGYRSSLIGKWHLGNTPVARGFDESYGFHSGCVDYYSHRYYWGDPRVPNHHDLYRNGKEIFEDGQYLTERLTEEACSFVKRSAAEPFFLYLAYNAPHYPMHAPRKYMDRFKSLDPERQTYAAMISAVDDGVGQLRDTLQRNGVDNNTCIILLGDNGATTEARAGLNGKPATAGSNGPYRGHKFSLFDGGTHVPCIMNYPSRLTAHTENTQTLMSIDILPTLLEYAQLQPPQVLDGQSIHKTRDTLFWKSNNQRAIREGNWKLVVNGITHSVDPVDGKIANRALSGEDALFLSDLAKDPGESKNLRRQHPEVLDRLLTKLSQWAQNQ